MLSNVILVRAFLLSLKEQPAKGGFSLTKAHIGSYVTITGNKPVICDCKEAEKGRKKLGLEPLDDYFRKRNMTYECYEEK